MTTSAPFEYQVADGWDEAVELMGLWGEDAVVLAGGQSLVPMLNLRLARPAGLIDLNPIPTPRPSVQGDTLVVPALTRQQQALRPGPIREHAPLLSHAVSHVGNVRVRARGTVGGSLCHADPTGEIPATVLALGGRMTARGPRGPRTIEAADFFRTHLTTALEPGEVLTEVRLPVTRPGQGWAFQEMVRRSSDFATVAVAVLAALDGASGTVADLRVVLGAVADRPLLLGPAAVSPVVSSTGTEHEVRAVAREAAASVSPESDVHASAGYRRRLVEVLTRRTITEALDRARATLTHEEAS